ncbi:MAG: methionyl-tRNA formyltransferase [Vulcanimicrobiaceae bacterium]
MLKTLFFGTSAFAVPSLQAVAKLTNLAGAVTQPDRPSGRGHKLVATPVKTAALELGVHVFEPLALKAFAEAIAGEGFDLFALASYGRILPASLLSVPALGSLNVHPSLLPRYRGATPIQSALANGDAETGVSVMLMDAGMDTGPIVLQERLSIRDGETYGELHDRLAVAGARLLGDAIANAQLSGIAATPQRGEPSITRPLSKPDLEIGWTRPATEIVDLVRSLSPSPAARANLGGLDVKVLRARAIAGAPTVRPGTLIGTDGDALVVAAAGGSVAVEDVIAPSRGRESGASFWRRVSSATPRST